MTTYEHAARTKKVALLVETLVRAGVSVSMAREAAQSDWELAAAHAGVKPPSAITINEVIKALEEIECKK